MLGALGYESPEIERLSRNFRGGLRRDVGAYTADSKIYWELARDLTRHRVTPVPKPRLAPNPSPPQRRLPPLTNPVGKPLGPPEVPAATTPTAANARRLIFTPLTQVGEVVRRYGRQGYGLYNVGGEIPTDFPHTFPTIESLNARGPVADLPELASYLSELESGSGRSGLAQVRKSLRVGPQAGPLILTVGSELQAQALAGIVGRSSGGQPSYHFRQGNTKIERPLKELPPGIGELPEYALLEAAYRDEFPAGAPRRSAESLFEDAIGRSGITPSDEQIRAILSPAKDVAVIAPAGTGKTTVAALRSAAMLIGRVQGGSQTAWRMLNLAFNRTAARDLGLEAYGVLPPEVQRSLQRVDQQTIGRTIHSLAESAVLPSLARYRRGQKSPAFLGHEKYVPVGEDLPRIVGTRFQVEALARVMGDLGIIPPAESSEDDSGRESPDWFLGDVAQEARAYLAEISWAKMNNLFPDEYARHLQEQGRTADPWYSRAAVLYDEYQSQKAEANLLDFDDLLLLFYRLLTEDPWTFRKYNGASEAGGYDHVLVDEFQDVRPLEWLTIEQMRRPDGRLVVLGDPEQAIYTTFREAVGSLEGVSELGVFRSDPEVFSLPDNYRSARAITASLRGLTGREWERSYFDRPGEVHVYPTLTPETQNELIADLVQEDIARGVPPQNIAVSARASSFLYRPEHPDSGLFGALRRRGVPAILEPSEQQKLDMSLAELLRFQLLKSLNEG
ncbi:MAG TPA: UvrD-helicase domain-containing protein, partial [Anaeromyxobacteraceae bacterium]|nr:UvrD-helicase domain-containing protein [Anaeromyxobacteraceae bacterium]